jgi:hypothetical protein
MCHTILKGECRAHPSHRIEFIPSFPGQCGRAAASCHRNRNSSTGARQRRPRASRQRGGPTLLWQPIGQRRWGVCEQLQAKSNPTEKKPTARYNTRMQFGMMFLGVLDRYVLRWSVTPTHASFDWTPITSNIYTVLVFRLSNLLLGNVVTCVKYFPKKVDTSASLEVSTVSCLSRRR